MKRVCLTGVESTGKSTLAPVLAAHFGGVVMPEYGRIWAERHGLDFSVDALRRIAVGHIEMRNVIARQQPVLIVEDTDIVMTAAWSRMLHGQRDPVLSAIAADADLYLLFAADTPWIDDATRQFGGEQRAKFDAIIVDELTLRSIEPQSISGDWPIRQTRAQEIVQALLDGGR